MHEVRGTSCTELAGRTRRTRSVQANGDRVRKEHARLFAGDLETICSLLEADPWSLLRKGGMLTQPLDEKLLLPVHYRIVDGSSAKIHSGHHLHGFHLWSSMLTPLSLAELKRWAHTTGVLMSADVFGGSRNLAESRTTV